MKTCSKCNNDHNLINFNKDSRTKDGYSCWCKGCYKKYNKIYCENNKDNISKIGKEYYQNNKDKCKEYYLINKEKIKEYYENNKYRIKEYYLVNRDRIKKQSKEYRENNKDRIKEQSKKYNQNNKDKINLRTNNRRKEDIQFRLSCNLRRRLTIALKGNYKSGSAIKDLGCSINDLKWWLEFWFEEDMNWDNYGNKDDQWSIDHIIPLSKVDLTKKKDLLKVCNYKNLQPLWHIENIKKGNK